jgi:predicted CoA-binding protein
MNDSEMKKLFETAHTIATVGLSTDPEKPAHYVPEYLQSIGYHIIPVNPRVAEILEQKAYPDLLSIPEPVDVVQIFRPRQDVPAIVEQAIQMHARVVWMQIGTGNREAAYRAEQTGLEVVMDRCMMVEHNRLFGS